MKIIVCDKCETVINHPAKKIYNQQRCSHGDCWNKQYCPDCASLIKDGGYERACEEHHEQLSIREIVPEYAKDVLNMLGFSVQDGGNKNSFAIQCLDAEFDVKVEFNDAKTTMCKWRIDGLNSTTKIFDVDLVKPHEILAKDLRDALIRTYHSKKGAATKRISDSKKASKSYDEEVERLKGLNL